jgi:polyhydroxybutyrate depolymerase
MVVLHGGGGSGRLLKDTYGFKPFIDAGEFIAIYPDAGAAGWLPDHVAFLDAAIDDVMKREKIDRDHVFMTGASRGGLMTFVATQKSKHRFAAAGTVISSQLKGLLDEFPLSVPIDFAMIAGTEDPLMPYNGGWGAMGKPKTTGDPGARVVPVEEMIAGLVKLNGITNGPVVASLGNADANDGCTNEVRCYANPTTKLRVMLVKVLGGGHVVPGGKQYLPKSVIGPACSDFDHAAIMWDFFKTAGTGLPPRSVAEASR